MKYRVDKPISEILDILVKVIRISRSSLVIGSQHPGQRCQKQTNTTFACPIKLSKSTEKTDVRFIPTELTYRGNLSQKSLSGIVKREDVVLDSEYLETIFIAVPRSPLEKQLLTQKRREIIQCKV